MNRRVKAVLLYLADGDGEASHTPGHAGPTLGRRGRCPTTDEGEIDGRMPTSCPC